MITVLTIALVYFLSAVVIMMLSSLTDTIDSAMLAAVSITAFILLLPLMAVAALIAEVHKATKRSRG